jgi:hypothetical protein
LDEAMTKAHMDLALPDFFRVRQRFEGPVVEDVSASVRQTLESLRLETRVRSGETVAIATGSRGIANQPQVLAEIVRHLRALGAEPFIVPAMGSHGGGTAEGQQRILSSYGISEESCGCPIRSCMEVVRVCDSKLGFPVLFDRNAFEADHVVVCNRVKPHTLYSSSIQSGLLKMLMIGLGKREGAATFHRAILEHGFRAVLEDVGPKLLERCGVLAGVALVERGDDRTAWIEALPPERFFSDEPRLLEMANRWMPKLPFSDVDLLLIDEIGKNVSGSGLDVNVVGRKSSLHHAAEDQPVRIRFIAVRSLTRATLGNAVGLGIAEFCRSRVLREMDTAATRLNALTAGDLTAAMLPLDYETDSEILDAALPMIGLRPPAEARILWIRNTLQLAEVACSAPLFDEAVRRPELEVISELRPLPLGDDGNLPDRIAFDFEDSGV